MNDTYNHANYVQQDIERHEAAIRSAKAQKKMNGYTEMFLAVTHTQQGTFKYAKRFLTRAPNAASRGEWNLTEKDKRVLEELFTQGFEVFIITWDEEKDVFTDYTYKQFMEKAVQKPGRGDAPSYWSMS